jgi:Predicted membrane protein
METSKFLKQYNYAIIITVLFISIAIIAEIFRYTHYESGTFDLGIFAQMIKNTANGIFSPSSFPLYENVIGISQFAEHFSPILLILVPLYKIFSSPIMLLVVQAIMIGFGGFLVYYLARMFKLSHKVSLFVDILFFVNPLVWSLVLFDFHELCFAVPLILLMFVGYFKKNWWIFGIGLGLALMVKEDVIATIGILGIILLISEWIKNKRKIEKNKVNRYAIVMVCSAFIVGIIAVTISAILSKGSSPLMLSIFFSRYSSGNTSIVSTVIFYVRHTLDIYSIEQVIAYFAPLCFLPFVCVESTEWSIPALFILGMVTISTWNGQHNFINQYGATAVPYLFIAMIIGMTQININIGKNWKKFAMVSTVSMVIIFLLTSLTGINKIIFSNFDNNYKVASHDLNQIINNIPKGKNDNSISVTGNNLVFPHLISKYNAYASETQFGINSSIFGYPQTITNYVITDTNSLIAQNYTLTLTSKEQYNWDELESKELSQDSRYKLIDSINGVSLWKLE